MARFRSRVLRKAPSNALALLAVLVVNGCAALLGYEDLRDLGPGGSGQDGGLDAPVSDAPVDGASPCDGADLQNDPEHCGACGRACPGCAAGRCPVETVASDLDPVSAVTTNVDSVLFTTNSDNDAGGALCRAAKAVDAGIPVPCVSPLEHTEGVAVDSSLVYVATNFRPPAPPAGEVMAFPVLFPGTVSSSLSVPVNTVHTIRKKDNRLYWSNSGGGIESCVPSPCPPPDGGPDCISCEDRQTVVPVTPTGATSFDFAAGNTVAWVAPAGGHIYACSEANGSCGSPGTWTTVAPVANDVDRMIVAGSDVVWVEDRSPAGAIRAAPTTPGAGATRTIVEADSVSDVVTDGVSVYFTVRGTTNDGTVERCPLAGCLSERSVLARGLSAPGVLTVDATHVYFTTRATRSTIERVAK